MKVRMLVRISGTRNGAKWPDPGETLDVSAGEAEDLERIGAGVRVSESREVESAMLDNKPKRGRPRKAE